MFMNRNKYKDTNTRLGGTVSAVLIPPSRPKHKSTKKHGYSPDIKVHVQKNKHFIISPELGWCGLFCPHSTFAPKTEKHKKTHRYSPDMNV